MFNAIADFLAWILYCEGISLVIHYLNDFLIFEPPESDSATRTRAILSFLGIQIDTIHFQLSLPADKVQRLQVLLGQWRTRRACTCKDLESLTGHLSHATTVIKPGCIFLRSLFSLMSRVSNPSHFIRLNVEVRADIAWWQCLLKHWNGLSFFPPTAPTTHVYSDVSGSFGCGAVNHD